MTTTHDASTRPHLEARYAAAVEAEKRAQAWAQAAAQSDPLDIEAARLAIREWIRAQGQTRRLGRQLARMEKTNWGAPT